MDIEVDVPCAHEAFPFEYALGDGRNGWVVTGLDAMQEFGKSGIKVVYFRRVSGKVCTRVVPSFHGHAKTEFGGGREGKGR